MKASREPWSLTYEMAPAPPPPMAWDKYESRAKREWTKLLHSEAARDENAIHHFLEQHPSFIPGAFSFPTSGHYPFPTAVISKPPLNALGLKIPDFMWIACASFTLYPVLVEIETPAKRWLTKSGDQHSDLTHAQNQLAHWKAWFGKPQNQAVFMEYFQIPQRLRELHFEPQYVLIHGSRSEFQERPQMRAVAARFQREDERLMTFSGLTPSRDAGYFLCVRKTADSYEAVCIPPTIQLFPGAAMDWQYIHGKEDAARKSAWLTQKRRDFLVERFPYWDKWAASCDGSYTTTSSSYE
jgi:hypothetical protein